MPAAQPGGNTVFAPACTSAVRVTPNRVAIAARAAPLLPATAPTSVNRSGNLAMTSHA